MLKYFLVFILQLKKVIFYFELYKGVINRPKAINRMQILMKKTKESLFCGF